MLRKRCTQEISCYTVWLHIHWLQMYSGPAVWNSLLPALRENMSLATFKTKLKTYFVCCSQWLLKTTRRCCGGFAISAPWYKWLYLLTYLLTCLSCCHHCVQLSSWPETASSRMTFTLYPIQFPDDSAQRWRELFKLCASQRLFIPVSRALKCSFSRVGMVMAEKVTSWLLLIFQLSLRIFKQKFTCTLWS